MAANAWTIEENEQFKNAVQWFPAFLPNRFESIARSLRKSVVDVMEHYQEMVDDLREIRSNHIAFADWIERPRWDKEEHEWFLIGLRRVGRDYDKIAVLLGTKTPVQVAIYARDFETWHNSKNNVMNRRRTRQITMGDTSVDSSSQQDSLVPLQPQPQQGPVALQTGPHDSISDSESTNLP